MPTFATTAGALCYETHGDPTKPPILLIHGVQMNRHFWDTTIAHLQDRYFCIAVDLLGMGESDLPTEADYTPRAHAERLLALLDSLNIDRFAVIGHSMGGWIGGYLAAVVAPERTAYWVSVGGVVTGNLGLATKLRDPFNWLAAQLPFVWGWLRPLVRVRLIAWLSHGRVLFYDMSRLDRAVWHAAQLSIYSPAHAKTHWANLRRVTRRHDLTPHLSGVTAKTLAIIGMQDQVVYARDQALVAEHVVGAQQLLIDACGHQPNYEAWPQFSAALNECLAEWGG